MKEFTDEFINELISLIQANNKEKAKEILDDLHPADIAELLQHLDTDEAEFVVSLLDGDTAADMLMELDEDDRHRLHRTPRHRRCRRPHTRA